MFPSYSRLLKKIKFEIINIHIKITYLKSVLNQLQNVTMPTTVYLEIINQKLINYQM